MKEEIQDVLNMVNEAKYNAFSKGDRDMPKKLEINKKGIKTENIIVGAEGMCINVKDYLKK